MADHHSPIFSGTATGDLVSTDRPVVAVTDLLTSAGWQVAVLPPVADEAAFHREVAAVLGFPSYYGANLDALWDCLSDLDAPTALVWQGWSELAIGEPHQWARVLQVLRERTESNPAFAVVLEAS